MATHVVEPDLKFIRDVAGYGGASSRQCFQCATCSVVCKLSPDQRPFPRKEMVWAQWGMKDRLVADPDIWLCHQCNDCSINCPRGAKPGKLLAALRHFSFRHWAWPRFMGNLIANARLLPLVLLATLGVIVAVIGLTGDLTPPGPVEYGHFWSHSSLNIFFSVLVLFVVAAFVIGTRRMLRAMRAAQEAAGNGTPSRGLVSGFLAGAGEFLAHRQFSKCGSSKMRLWGHLLTFYGFLGLLVATAIVVLLIIVDPSSYPIHSLTHPLKLLGNLSTLAFLAGLTIIIYERLANEDYAGNATAFDWIFVLVLYAIGWTGLLTQALRFWDVAAVAYPVYLAHLTLVFYLLVYAPYSKFAHMVYRAVAIVFAKRYGRS